MTEVTVVIGAGSIGQATARRVSTGKYVVLAGLRRENADAANGVILLRRARPAMTSVSRCRPPSGSAHGGHAVRAGSMAGAPRPCSVLLRSYLTGLMAQAISSFCAS